MGQTDLLSYERSQCGNDTRSLGLPRLMSTARADGSLDGINGYVSVTKMSLEDGGHAVGQWERWNPPGILTQVILPINEYLSGLQSRYVEENGQVISCATTLRPNPVMGVMMMMMSAISKLVFSWILLFKVLTSQRCLHQRFCKWICIYRDTEDLNCSNKFSYASFLYSVKMHIQVS